MTTSMHCKNCFQIRHVFILNIFSLRISINFIGLLPFGITVAIVVGFQAISEFH